MSTWVDLGVWTQMSVQAPSYQAQQAQGCDLTRYPACWYHNPPTITRPDLTSGQLVGAVQPFIWAGNTAGIKLFYKVNFSVGGVQVTNNDYQQFDGNSQPLNTVLGTASASVDGTVNGFGRYTLTVEAYSTNTVGNSVVSSPHNMSSATYQLNPTISIMRNGQDITNASSNVSLGEGISLSAAIGPAGALTNATQEWSIPCTQAPAPQQPACSVVAGYAPSDQTATKTDWTATTTQATKFYWWRGTSPNQVQYKLAFRDGTNVIARTTFNVQAPTVSITTQTTSVNVMFPPLPANPSQPDLIFGTYTLLDQNDDVVSPSQKGITLVPTWWNGSYYQAFPATTGSFEWIQLVLSSSAHRHSSLTNTWQSSILQPGDSPALDSEYPYGVDFVNFPADALVLTDRPTKPLFATDAKYPGDSFDEYQRTDHFLTYFMFMPPASDSIWVLLEVVDWQWNGDAGLQADGTTWTLKASADFNNTGFANSPAAPVSLPLWTFNIITLGAVGYTY